MWIYYLLNAFGVVLSVYRLIFEIAVDFSIVLHLFIKFVFLTYCGN